MPKNKAQHLSQDGAARSHRTVAASDAVRIKTLLFVHLSFLNITDFMCSQLLTPIKHKVIY